MKHRTREPFVFVAALLTVSLLWLLFTGSKQVHEWIVGAISTLCTMIFFRIVYRQELQRFDLQWRDAFALWRVPWYLMSGMWEITAVLAQDLAGRRAESLFRVSGFRTAKETPLHVTRRALATAYTSIAPNFIVLGIDYRQSRMLFHQLRRSAVPRMTRELGAEVGAREQIRSEETASTPPSEPAR